MQTPITITIESARFFETTLGVFSQRSTFFTSSNHGVQGKGERRGRHLEGSRFFETTLGVVRNALLLLLLLTMDCRERVRDRKKAGRKIARPF